MKESKVKVGLFIAAVIILVAILISNHSKSRKAKTRRTTYTADEISALSVRESGVIKKKVKRTSAGAAALLQDVGREDPFLPPDATDIYVGAQHAKLNISGITFDARGKPLAIINNQLIGEGGTIGKVEIVKISENSVIVLEEGIEYTLRLGNMKTGKP